MELFLQFGYGMKKVTLDLSKKWKGVSVILSPRDINPSQLSKWSEEFEKNGVKTLFDPQCYYPKDTQKGLPEYSFWDKNLNSNIDLVSTCTDAQLTELLKYNNIAKTDALILPCMMNEFDDVWENRFIHQSERYIESAHKLEHDKPLIATIALPSGLLLQSESRIDLLLQSIMKFDVDGYYVVAESLEKNYLIDNPVWLSNVLGICAALKISGKKVIYGYGNHQLLPLALLKADAMASGTWQNVRSFTNRFKTVDQQKKKSTWVYCAEALSEYKLSFIDYAFQVDYLRAMFSNDKDYIDDGIKKILQSDLPPSTTGFTETDAFKHYLCCLKHQVKLLDKKTYREAYSSYEMILNTAEHKIEQLEKRGIYAQARSFKEYIDVNRAALTRLNNNYGFQLEMIWRTKSE